MLPQATRARVALVTHQDIAAMAVAMRERCVHITPVSWQGLPAWLKLAVPPSPAWRYQLLGLAARALRLTALQPLRPPGGHGGLALEARRLQGLREAGLRVPEVLADSTDWLVLADLGSITLEHSLRQASADERLRLWQEGAAYLIRAHRAGQYLSQAFSRNFVCSVHGLGAIDFEDDSCAMMTLTDAQVRDWLPYCFSTAIYFRERLPELRAALDAALVCETPAVREGVARALARTAWLRAVRRLPARMQRRDVLKTAAYGELAALY